MRPLSNVFSCLAPFSAPFHHQPPWSALRQQIFSSFPVSPPPHLFNHFLAVLVLLLSTLVHEHTDRSIVYEDPFCVEDDLQRKGKASDSVRPVTSPGSDGKTQVPRPAGLFPAVPEELGRELTLCMYRDRIACLPRRPASAVNCVSQHEACTALAASRTLKPALFETDTSFVQGILTKQD